MHNKPWNIFDGIDIYVDCSVSFFGLGFTIEVNETMTTANIYLPFINIEFTHHKFWF